MRHDINEESNNSTTRYDYESKSIQVLVNGVWLNAIPFDPDAGISLIPKLESNHGDNGEASTDCSYSSAIGQWPTAFDGGNNAYKAFDQNYGNDGLTEYGDDNVKRYVQYTFNSPIKLKRMEVKYRTSSGSTGLYFDYYDIATSQWVNFYSQTDLVSTNVTTLVKELDALVETNKIRVRTDGGRSATRMVICDISAYGLL
ncbi:MAG: hypothetical protein MJZ03_03885 [archaeon]|nr:hypothetical protein [archaeon]